MSGKITLFFSIIDLCGKGYPKRKVMETVNSIIPTDIRLVMFWTSYPLEEPLMFPSIHIVCVTCAVTIL